MSAILFDGGCALCARSVRFILHRDPSGRFHFRSLQDPVSQRWLAAHGHTSVPDSLILVEGDRLLYRSEGALAIGRRLRAPWPLLAALASRLPRRWLDAAYDAIARRRIRWFGRIDDTCSLTDTLPPERVWQPAPPDARE